MRTRNLKYFGWLYILFGIAVIIFGDLNLEYPLVGYNGSTAPASTFPATDIAIVSVLGILITVVGYLDYRSARSNANKIVLPAVLIVLGIALVPLFTYYGAFNGILLSGGSKTGAYDLSGLSMGGLLLIFAALGEIYLMRNPTAHL